MDRSETAWFLIDRSAEAGVADDSGMTALVMMISKMPSVVSGVYLALKGSLSCLVLPRFVNVKTTLYNYGRHKMTATKLYTWLRLDYQPLFRKVTRAQYPLAGTQTALERAAETYQAYEVL